MSEDTDVDPKAVLDKLTSGVSYDNIEPGIDLQYILSSTSLKENIIVKQKRDSYTFELNLNVKKLTPTLQDNGSIHFHNDGGETIFTIPAPFMTDADGNYSEAVSYTLAPGKKNKEYTLTITANADWMNAEDRAFPVTIDPIVSTPQTNSACTTTNVFSEIPYESYLNEGMPIVGQCDDGTYRIYMEFNLPDLPAVSMVTGAMLSVAIFKGTQDSAAILKYTMRS